MNSETVDLIATDPPFNKGRDFHATPDSLAAGAKFQDRWSWEQDVHEEWTDQITDDHPRLMEAIESARYAHSDGMGAYMCFMAVRLIEMHRVLKSTGSIYLHCDPTASHYLKAVMDAIFGWQRFRNEIVWERTTPKGLMSRRYPTNHDVLLSYERSDQAIWNLDEAFIPYDLDQLDAKTLQQYAKQDSDGRRYQLTSLLNPNKDRPNLTYKFLGIVRVWRWERERMHRELEAGRIIQTAPGRVPRFKRYLDEQRGKPLTDIWMNIYRSGEEDVGYPTQKPLTLYERLIRVSSNEGDVVCDPFAGCATTLVAAEKLQRQWVGMDIWEGAHKLVVDRLRETTGLFGEVTFTAEPPPRTDDGETGAPFLRVKERVQEPEGPVWSRAEMYDYLLKQQGQKCQGCDREFDDPRYLELDHNTPRSDGGLNHISNRILLCSPCNRLKSNTYTLSGLRYENKKQGYMKAG